MSADSAPVQEDPQMNDYQSETYNGQEDRALASIGFKPYEDELDQPLNAEEATVLVLHFLRRMRKRVISPKKAVQNGDIFVVDVELQQANAVVNIDAKTREIVEYEITPLEKERKPLPISLRKLALFFGTFVVAVVAMMAVTLFNFHIPTFETLFQNEYFMDYIIYAAVILIAIGGVIWWRRRS